MSRFLRTALGSVLLSLLFFSCQKEVSFEQGQVSKGSLQSTAGDCLPKQVKGTYKVNQALGDTNYIEVTINVTQTGTYTITTDTVHGYFFRATGNFSALGSATIQLKGSGTPTTAGTDLFNVRYDGSLCSIAVPVVASGSGGGSSSAAYSLQANGGNCSSSTVSGTYTQGTALTSANKIDVQVNVTTPGTWTITTTTVTGFSFTGSGTFTTTGVQTVTLTGSGTPTSAGAQVFAVTAGTSTCNISVTVAANTAPTAAFSLVGAPGSCSISAASGTYTQGTALTSSNTVTLQVNVTTAGQWAVTSNTVTGMTFAGAGTFAATGAQTIVLTGTGTPTTVGTQTFSITAGSSTCTYTITVTAATAPNTDHFPLTANSYWTYDYSDPGSTGDTLARKNTTTTAFSGNTYRVFEETDTDGDPSGDYFYRKSGNNYYEYTSVHNYALVTFDDPAPEGDILFMKEGLATGDTWMSAEYAGTESGTPKKLRYVFTCTNANATATINSRTFNNVYKISFKSQVSTSGGAYADEGLTWEAWYAQGIGMIYMKGTFGTASLELKIRRWQVF